VRKTQLQALLAIGESARRLPDPAARRAGGFVGVGLMVFSAILTAPAACSRAPRASTGGRCSRGAALALIGVPLGLVLEAPGGLLTATGGGLAMVELPSACRPKRPLVAAT
jgi:hypothetical protein